MDMELVAREPLIKTATRSEGTALAVLRASVRQLLIQHDAANFHANPATLKARDIAAYGRALRDVIRLIDRTADE